MENEKWVDPIYIGLLGAFAVMQRANRLAHLIEKLRLLGGRFSPPLVAVGRYTRSGMLHDGAPLTGGTIHPGNVTSKAKEQRTKHQSRARFAQSSGSPSV